MKKKLLLLTACLMAIFSVQAQKLIVGEYYGTTDYFPIRTYYKYSFTEQIYTVEEIGCAGTITSVGFYNQNSDAQTRTLDVYVAQTDQSNLYGGWVNMTNDNKVFSGSVTFAKNEWTTIPFDTPLAYDGTQNLLIAVNDRTGSYVNTVSFRATIGQSGGEARYLYKDGTGAYNPLDMSAYAGEGSTSSYKNLLQLGIKVPVAIMDEEDNIIKSLDLGSSETAVSKDVVIKNTTEQSITVDAALTCTPDNSFTISTQQITVAAGATQKLTVTMPSSIYGSRTGELTLSYGDNTTKLALKGTIIPPSVALDEEHFPDANFRYLISYRHDTNKDGILSGEEILALKYLDFYMGYNYHVATLKGMEYFVELEKFEDGTSECTFDFEELDMSQFVKLTYFECELNNLKTLNLSNNKLLKSLNCGRNPLTTLDLSNNTELERLDCENCQLSTIDLTGLTKLKYVDISMNPLTESPDFSACKDIESLYCASCGLKSLNLANLEKLENLNIYGNNIRGKGMDDLIASLPKFEGKWTGEYNDEWQEYQYIYYKPYNFNPGNETTLNNVVTETQFNTAKEKGWKFAYYSYYSLNEYYSPDGLVLADDNFPDENLQNALFGAVDANKDGVLVADEIANVTELYVDYKNISRMKGIENFTALQEIRCQGNNLQSEAVDELITCLPNRANNDGEIVIKDFTYDEEKNVVTQEQAKAANAKGWTVYAIYNSVGIREFGGAPLPVTVVYKDEEGNEIDFPLCENDMADINKKLTDMGLISEGNFAYDKDTRTLSLNGLKAEKLLLAISYYNIEYGKDENPYTVKVNDVNELMGLYASDIKELSVTGNGMLNVFAYGFMANVSDLIIDGPTIGVDSSSEYALAVTGVGFTSLEVKSGRLRLKATKHPLYMTSYEAPKLTLGSGIEVLSPADVVWTTTSYEGYYTYADGTPLGTATLEIGVVDGIHGTTVSPNDDNYYTIDGRRLNGQPTQKGLYIHNGKVSVFNR